MAQSIKHWQVATFLSQPKMNTNLLKRCAFSGRCWQSHNYIPLKRKSFKRYNLTITERGFIDSSESHISDLAKYLQCVVPHPCATFSVVSFLAVFLMTPLQANKSIFHYLLCYDIMWRDQYRERKYTLLEERGFCNPRVISIRSSQTKNNWDFTQKLAIWASQPALPVINLSTWVRRVLKLGIKHSMGMCQGLCNIWWSLVLRLLVPWYLQSVTLMLKRGQANPILYLCHPFFLFSTRFWWCCWLKPYMTGVMLSCILMLIKV